MFEDETTDTDYFFTDPLWSMWMTITGLVTIVGICVFTMPKRIPIYLLNGLLYGKLAPTTDNKILKLMQIPKRWFFHFYVFATIINAIHFAIIFRLYILEIPVPALTLTLLNFLVPSREVSVDTFSAFLVMLLLFVHTTRRLYECLFISVYSNGKISLFHYMLGYFFYFAVTLTLLSESPGFSMYDARWFVYQLPPFYFRWYHLFGVILYCIATVVQHQSHVILADLRKNERGEVVSTAHFIPDGRMFNYVSCPHYFAEILIYISLYVVLGFQHYGWTLVLYWVIACQIISGLLTHKWYQEKHKDAYPEERKAIIPFIW